MVLPSRTLDRLRGGRERDAMSDCVRLLGIERDRAIQTIRAHHYTHSVPAGKTHYFGVETALVTISIPANQYIGRFLFGRDRVVWELSRLWAPDGHHRNLLTAAIAQAVRQFRQLEPETWALVSYADPNVGHAGFVYKAASWLPCGQVEESRYYLGPDGVVVSRRKFHSGGKALVKAEIVARGFTEVKRPGRLRFCLPFSRTARREFFRQWGPKGTR